MGTIRQQRVRYICGWCGTLHPMYHYGVLLHKGELYTMVNLHFVKCSVIASHTAVPRDFPGRVVMVSD